MTEPSKLNPAVLAADTQRYWAFISYSHADKTWGDWLHKALETYRIPKALQGTTAPFGSIPKRLFPIFRDREELPSSSDLASNITEALLQSRTLIVICTPRSAASRWVNEEILQFKRLGKADRILCLIVDGEPNAADKPGREAEECFPEALKYALGENGNLSTHRTEPIAADARPIGDGKRDALLKVVAGILGIPFDALRRRDQQRRNRRLAFGLTAALAFVLGSTALTIFAVRQQHLAEVARDRADDAVVETKAQRTRAEGSEVIAQREAQEAKQARAAAETSAEQARVEGIRAIAQAKTTAEVWDSLQVGIQQAYPQPDFSKWPPALPLSIYFHSDRSFLSEEAQKLLTRFAEAWLASNRKSSVVIEGHVSEISRTNIENAKGVQDGMSGRNREYALPLGERLARSVESFLIQCGIPVTRIATRSYGKERPKYPIILMNNRVEVRAAGVDDSIR